MGGGWLICARGAADEAPSARYTPEVSRKVRLAGISSASRRVLPHQHYTTINTYRRHGRGRERVTAMVRSRSLTRRRSCCWQAMGFACWQAPSSGLGSIGKHQCDRRRYGVVVHEVARVGSAWRPCSQSARGPDEPYRAATGCVLPTRQLHGGRFRS